ncbi:MAG TPA: SpoIIE family protein phosphatase [Candidatus Ozemobacteraceae bacterium]|nr:SpoIIE family protein phosphatase [Candidatus Ozemobacteraceae bacterium]
MNTRRPSLPFSLLLALPLFFGWLMLEHARIERLRSETELGEEQLFTSMQKCCYEIRPLSQIHRGLQSLRQHIRAHDYRYSAVSPWPRTFPEGYRVQAGIFSPSGELSEPAWAPIPFKFVWKQFWQDFCRRRTTFAQLTRYQKAFGNWLGLDDVENDDLLQEVSTPSGIGFFYTLRGPEQAGLLLFVSDIPSPIERWKQRLQASHTPSLDLWIFDPRSDAIYGAKPLTDREQRFLRLGQVQTGATRCEAGQRYATLRTEENLILLGRTPDRTDHRRGLEQWVIAFLTIIPLLTWICAGDSFLLRLSIHTRLLLLFAASALLPYLLLREMSFRHQEDIARQLESTIRQEQTARLHAAEDQLRHLPQRQNRVYQRLSREVRQRVAAGPEAMDAVLRDARAQRLLDAYSLLDSRGQELCSHWNDQSIRDLAKLFAEEMLTRYRENRYPQPDDSLRWSFFQVIQSPIIGFDTIADSRGICRPIKVSAAASALWYWDTFSDARASAPAFIGLVQGLANARLALFQRELPSGVFAFDATQHTWYPQAPRLPHVDELVGQAFVGRRTLATRQVSPDGETLILLFPSAVEPNICFLIADDANSLRERISAIQRRYQLAGMFILIMTGFLASVLARTLLSPLEQLSRGVTTFESGGRVPVLTISTSDEIGVMTEAFNAMVQEAREVDAARKVQESLIPLTPAQLPGIRSALRYLPLENLAGDYGDVIPRPDGTLLVAIGDVTGHGIGSALQTAMAKAVCYHACQTQATLPELFARLNAILHQGRSSRRFMTFCGGVLSPHTGIWHWISAGHGYPLIRYPDGRIEFLKSIGVPLGMQASRRWQVSEVKLTPGTMLLFYTDGLVEACNVDQQPFDYEGLRTAFGQATGGPDEVAEQILRVFHRYTGNVPLTDDVTLLVLEWTGAPQPA